MWGPSAVRPTWGPPTWTTWRRPSTVDDWRASGWWWTVPTAAASDLAAAVFEQLGAEVVAIGCDPDGTNINSGCGSTATELLAGAVVERGANLGLALDGDADRLLAVDETGALVDGDSLLALFARDMADRGQLAGNTVVVTVMTNLGFRRAMERAGDPREGDRRRRPPRAVRHRQGGVLAREGSSRVTSSSAAWPRPETAC